MVTFDANGEHDCHEQRDRPDVVSRLGEVISLHKHAVNESQKMRQWENLADELPPNRNSLKRKHETEQQDRRHEEKEGQETQSV